jgi:transcription initiation factor TFIID subunit TAF12
MLISTLTRTLECYVFMCHMTVCGRAKTLSKSYLTIPPGGVTALQQQQQQQQQQQKQHQQQQQQQTKEVSSS